MPAWSPTGTELYYLAELTPPRTMMKVERLPGGENSRGAPEELFHAWFWYSQAFRTYDVSPSGRFLTVQIHPVESIEPRTHLKLVLNWAEELERLVPSSPR